MVRQAEIKAGKKEDVKGKKEDVANYRPISLLCVVSKVLERCVFNQVKEHVDKYFVRSQHGFLKGRFLYYTASVVLPSASGSKCRPGTADGCHLS